MVDADVREQLRELQNEPNLGQFIMRDVKPTGRQLGVGSYGSVEEIKVGGLVCAGKTIHEALVDVENIGAENIAQKYVQECRLMAGLRHPNVTQFLGLCFLPPATLPVLLMERLEGSLDDLLETTPNIPLALKRSILEDVARGLLYLHKQDPPIIHRDLTAKNVLLTSSFAAKITDLGNSRIVNLQPGQLARTMSQLPGTLAYMPPEALSMVSRYGPSLDIFSFGHLGLFTGLQVFPGALLEPTFPDSDNPEKLVGRSEVERRGLYFQQLEKTLLRGEQHPFFELVKRCLHNIPSKRPTTEVLLRTLEEMRAEIEGPYGSYDIVKLDLMRQVAVTRTLRQSESEVRRKDREIKILQQELDQTQDKLRNEIKELTTRLNQAQVERHRAEERVSRVQEQLQVERAGFEERLRTVTLAQRENDRKKEERFGSLQEQLMQLEVLKDSLYAELRAKDRELQQNVSEIRRLHLELQSCQSQQQGMQHDDAISKGELHQHEEAQTVRLGQSNGGNTYTLQTPQHPLELKWRRGRNMPVGIDTYPHVVVIGSQIYIGGEDARAVMVYDIYDDEMNELPPLNYQHYGMTAHNSQLVLVGGRHHSTGKTISELYVWDSQNDIWTNPFPPMTVPTSGSSMISYDHFVLVVGGEGDNGECVGRTQILDTMNMQWYQTTPLPEPCANLTSCVIGSMCFLLGGWSRDGTPNKQVLNASLHKLISNAVSPSPGVTPSPWDRLEDLPVTFSTALALQGSLLAVGGLNSSAIYAYQTSSSKSWVKVGDLPREIERCGCAIHPSGGLLVAGGYQKEKGNVVFPSGHSVDIATAEFL